MEEPANPEKYQEALIEAEEAARKIIEKALGIRASDYTITLSITYDEKGVLRATIDLSISRAGVDKKTLDEVAEAALEIAKKVFERRIIEQLGEKPSRHPKKR